MTTREDRKSEVTAGKAVRAKPTRKEQLTKLLNRKSGTVIERSDTDKGAVYRIVRDG